MKRIIRTFLFVIMMAVSYVTALAQQSDLQLANHQQRISREQLAEIEAKHIAQELAFSDTVMEKFITTYCNYQKEIWALGPRHRPDKKDMSERENENRIKQRFATSEKILNIRQKYYKEYSKFLTQAQIEKMYEQERKIINRRAKREQKQSDKK